MMKLTHKYLKVSDIDNYDSLNLLQANIVRAMLLDPEDCVVQLTWISL